MENLFRKRQERLSIFQRFRNKELTTSRKEIPDHIIKRCNECEANMPFMELVENSYVCPVCNHHFKISARERLRQLLDDRSFKEFDRYATTKDKDDFPGYQEKLERYQKETGLKEAVVCGVGTIDKQRVVIAVMDSNFMMASMGSVVGDKITRTIEFATKKKLPLLICCASGGARMQEGIISLMQMAKTSAALQRYNQMGGFYISLLTHPTTGGVSASFAMLGDIILAEPKALIGFAGKRVIEKTINETLPENFQSAEFLLEKGFIDRIVERKELKKEIATLLAMHSR